MSGKIKFYAGFSSKACALWSKPLREACAADRMLVLPRSPENDIEIVRVVNAVDAFDDLLGALRFYVAICGNAAASVTRESAQEAYDLAQAALANATKAAGS